MQDIDISKLKNVKNSLSESDIFHLNEFFNSFGVKEEIIEMQKITKKRWIIKNLQKIYEIITSPIVMLLLWAIIIYFMTPNEEQKINMLLAFWWIIFFNIIFIRKIFRWIDKKFGLEKYKETKKNFLVKISANLPEILRLQTKEIDKHKLVEDLKNRKIFQSDYYRASLDDVFVFGKKNDEILLGEWRSYKMTGSNNTDSINDSKIFFKKNFENSRTFSEEIIVKTKNYLLWKFGEKYESAIFIFWMSLIAFSLIGLGIYSVMNPGGIKWDWGMWAIIIGVILFISSILIIIFYKTTPKIQLSENAFSEKFAVFSDNPLAKDIFENIQIQIIFLDFLQKNPYKYDFYFWEKNIVVIRNERKKFLEFDYKSNASDFIELFVDFCIEQKMIYDFMEQIRVFYK